MIFHGGLDGAAVKNLQRSKQNSGGMRTGGEFINNIYNFKEPDRELSPGFGFDAQPVPCLRVESRLTCLGNCTLTADQARIHTEI